MSARTSEQVELTDAEEVALENALFANGYGVEFMPQSLVTGVESIVARRLADERANPRDEFHTMNELYEYRMLYNALLFNEWALTNRYPVCKSWSHSDGEACFGGGWFIVVAELPTGQISNHYKADHWGLFCVPTVMLPPTYDGHAPADVAERMKRLFRDAKEST